MDTSPSFDSLSLSNVNSAVGAFVFEVLARLGVEMVVTCPGSRSTPLTFAASRNPRLETVSFLDERSAAFFALGYAKSKRKPVVIVCTSGTAASNFLPAIVEAQISKVPLIVFTADRPFELRNCSEGQVIDQTKLYGNFVNQFFEIGVPENDISYFNYIRQTLIHVVHRFMGLDSGPCHINFPFREPLAPDEGQSSVMPAEELLKLASVMIKLTEIAKPSLTTDRLLLEKLSSHRKGIIVVGTFEGSASDAQLIKHLAIISDKLGWPILADALNPVRNHSNSFSHLVTHYDAFLRDGQRSKDLIPSAILQIGKLPTSKILRSWIQKSGSQRFLFNDTYDNIDPLHGCSIPLMGDLGAISESLEVYPSDEDWLRRWDQVEMLYEDAISRELDSIASSFEGKVSKLLSTELPEGSAIMIANSMSVRYAESYWVKNNLKNRIFFNRGANGIDGTLSTALGLAHNGLNTFLLTGDLAFLHDTNGLQFANKLKGSLSIILVNNNGGGIFEFLPISKFDSFEDYFATPQTVDYELLAQAFGVQYCKVNGISDLRLRLKEVANKSIRIIEIITDRSLDIVTHKDLNKIRQL